MRSLSATWAVPRGGCVGKCNAPYIFLNHITLRPSVVGASLSLVQLLLSSRTWMALLRLPQAARTAENDTKPMCHGFL